MDGDGRTSQTLAPNCSLKIEQTRWIWSLSDTSGLVVTFPRYSRQKVALQGCGQGGRGGSGLSTAWQGQEEVNPSMGQKMNPKGGAPITSTATTRTEPAFLCFFAKKTVLEEFYAWTLSGPVL